MCVQYFTLEHSSNTFNMIKEKLLTKERACALAKDMKKKKKRRRRLFIFAREINRRENKSK